MHDETVDEDRVPELGLLTVPEEVWALAVRRAEVIGPLAEAGTAGAGAVEAAAEQLGISRRQVYVLLRRWREGQGVVSDLLPGRSSGGRGGQRLSAEVEAVIREVLRKHYLTRQRKTTAAVHREITRVCRTRGLPVPSLGAITRRIAVLDPHAETTARRGADAARALESAGGQVPPVSGVLEQVQIDHTVVDLIVVDEHHRLPIGRPYVTVAIDVFSRCIVGLVITLEAPSALSVGLCLAHMVTDKRAWLERLDIEGDWPMAGKPGELYLDNAAEFKSEALRRGCEQHGITLRYRPPGRPHYGGIIERVIGTLMEMVHELPGTTFSNPAQRGSYDSEAKAALTVAELVEDLPYSEAGKAYMATQIELDRAMELLLEELEEAGVADRTLVVLSSDHYPYGLTREQIEELEGHEVDDVELYRNSLVMYAPGMEPMTVDEPVASMDIIPTLSNLLGLEFDSRLLMGRDVFFDAEPLVIFSDRSFLTDKGRYDAVAQGFTPAEGGGGAGGLPAGDLRRDRPAVLLLGYDPGPGLLRGGRGSVTVLSAAGATTQRPSSAAPRLGSSHPDPARRGEKR